MRKVASFLALLLVIAGLSSCAGEKERDTGSPQQITRQGHSAPTEQELLAGLKDILARYEDRSELGNNFLRKKTGPFRHITFDQALMAYWHINSEFPAGPDPKSVVEKLESAHLLPFLAIDPISGDTMTIVSSENELKSHSDMVIELSPLGTFDYLFVDYNGVTYNPEIKRKEMSQRTANLSHIKQVTEGSPDGEITHEVMLPTKPEDVFRDMIEMLFTQIINHSFIVNGFKVPVNLKEFLAGALEVNPNGWGHPVGAIPDGQIGSFEIGVDPDQNAYYVLCYTERLGRVFYANKYYQKPMAGEMVYDVRMPDQMVMPIAEEMLTNRIPLLTDELFAGPPPQI